MQSSTSITIITICFNNLEDLLDTCSSVDGQVLKPYEHFIVNGSTKPDIEQWLSNNPQPSYRGWISERDKGIGDAFNKGINKTNGSILLMLNAGDKLGETDTLQKVVNAFNKSPNIAWLHGMYLYQRAGIWVVLGKPFDPGKIYRGMRSVCHQTMYVKRTVYDKYGLYDNDLKIGMDFDFLIRIRNEKFLFLKEILAVFAPGGLSMEDFNKNLKENTRIIEKNIGISWKHRLWTIRLWMLNKILTSPIGKPLYWLKNKLGLARF